MNERKFLEKLLNKASITIDYYNGGCINLTDIEDVLYYMEYGHHAFWAKRFDIDKKDFIEFSNQMFGIEYQCNAVTKKGKQCLHKVFNQGIRNINEWFENKDNQKKCFCPFHQNKYSKDIEDGDFESIEAN